MAPSPHLLVELTPTLFSALTEYSGGKLLLVGKLHVIDCDDSPRERIYVERYRDRKRPWKEFRYETALTAILLNYYLYAVSGLSNYIPRFYHSKGPIFA